MVRLQQLSQLQLPGPAASLQGTTVLGQACTAQYRAFVAAQTVRTSSSCAGEKQA